MRGARGWIREGEGGEGEGGEVGGWREGGPGRNARDGDEAWAHVVVVDVYEIDNEMPIQSPFQSAPLRREVASAVKSSICGLMVDVCCQALWRRRSAWARRRSWAFVVATEGVGAGRRAFDIPPPLNLLPSP